MKTRRSFIKHVSAGSLATGLLTFPYWPARADKAAKVGNDDLTAGLPDILPEDYLIRQQKARDYMQQVGIDALLIEGGVNMNYFTGTGWGLSERLFAVVLSRNHDPVWIAPDFELKRAREVIRFGNDIRTWHEHESPYALLNGIMQDLHHPNGILGVGPNVRNFIVEGIRRDTKLQPVNGAPVTEACRAVKTEKELMFMDVANRITKLAYQESFDQIREGMTSDQLSGLIRQAHTRYGASGGGFALFAEASAFPHGTKDRPPLKEGDVILVDGGCSVKGFRSDVTRTVVYGKPTPRQKQVFDTVLEAQQKAFTLIKSGLPCQEADQAARKVVEKAGFGTGYATFTHRLGHGIGMEGHEYPYLVDGNALTMKPGMTFTNEPGIYLYGEFGIRIEDSFYVTESGYHNLGGMACLSVTQPFGT